MPSEPGRVTRGEYLLRDYELIVSHLHRREDAPAGARQCFVGYLEGAANPGFVPEELDKIRIGRRVRVTLRPLTPRPDGTVGYGKRITRRPRLQGADVALEDKAARRRLRRIGC